MEQWIFMILMVLVAIALPFILPYKKFAAFFGGFYHNKARHLILVTRNSQAEVEWRIWSYFFWSRIIGKKGNLTCIDTGSTDDTLKILFRLKKKYFRMEIIKLHPTVKLEEAIESCNDKLQVNKEKMVVLDVQAIEHEIETKNSA